MKTHKIIDLTYHEDEGNGVFVGTVEECLDWISEQGDFGFEMVELTPTERIIHNVL